MGHSWEILLPFLFVHCFIRLFNKLFYSFCKRHWTATNFPLRLWLVLNPPAAPPPILSGTWSSAYLSLPTLRTQLERPRQGQWMLRSHFWPTIPAIRWVSTGPLCQASLKVPSSFWVFPVGQFILIKVSLMLWFISLHSFDAETQIRSGYSGTGLGPCNMPPTLWVS